MELEGYQLFTINRVNGGGGVALYMHRASRCSKIEKLQNTVDNVLLVFNLIDMYVYITIYTYISVYVLKIHPPCFCK